MYYSLDLVDFFLFCFILFLSFLISFSNDSIYIIFYFMIFYVCVSMLLFYWGIHFVAIVFIIIYSGAISILFIFVLMLLNFRLFLFVRHKRDVWFFFLVLFLVLFLLVCLLVYSYDGNNDVYYKVVCGDCSGLYCFFLYELDFLMSLGYVFYNFYFYEFFLVSFMLLLSMVGSISLVLSKNLHVKDQRLFVQTLAKSNVFLVNE